MREEKKGVSTIEISQYMVFLQCFQAFDSAVACKDKEKKKKTVLKTFLSFRQENNTTFLPNNAIDRWVVTNIFVNSLIKPHKICVY